MGKQRNKHLGPAELPRNLEEFFTKQASSMGVQLLVNYIDELEKQNKALHEFNIHLTKSFDKLYARVEDLDEEIQRLKGVRIPTSKPTEPVEKPPPTKFRMARGANNPYGRSKGWYRST